MGLFSKSNQDVVNNEKTSKYPRVPFYLNTRTFTSHLMFGPYIWLPVAATLTWLGGLLALIGLWAAHGKPQYRSDESTVVYISDVGAKYKTLFICICACTSAFYVLSLFAERWLRHVDRLPADMRKREQVFDWIAISFTCLGSLGLILLSIFDAFNHSTVHWSMTVVFVVGVAISAIFQSAEIWSLHKDHPDRKHLFRNSIYKLVIVTIAIACAIGFGVCYAYSNRNTCNGDVLPRSCYKSSNAAAILEWEVAFILVFYFATLVADLWPAGKTSPRYLRRLAKWQEIHEPTKIEHDFTGREAFQNESAWRGPNGMALPIDREETPGAFSTRASTMQNSEAGLIREV